MLQIIYRPENLVVDLDTSFLAAKDCKIESNWSDTLAYFTFVGKKFFCYSFFKASNDRFKSTKLLQAHLDKEFVRLAGIFAGKISAGVTVDADAVASTKKRRVSKPSDSPSKRFAGGAPRITPEQMVQLEADARAAKEKEAALDASKKPPASSTASASGAPPISLFGTKPDGTEGEHASEEKQGDKEE